MEAISKGQAIEISRGSDPYLQGYIGPLQMATPVDLSRH